MQGNTLLGILIPIVFCGFVLTLGILWIKREARARARHAFATALESKGIMIDDDDVTIRREDDGKIYCKVVYIGKLFAEGEYHVNGEVFVRSYTRRNGDHGQAFYYPIDH